MTEPLPDTDPDIPTTGPLSRTCPRCKAPPGQHCITNTKRPLNGFHAPRTGKRITGHRALTLTPALTDHLCDKLAHGTSLTTAARTAGISTTTLHRWLALGESDHPDHQVFRVFRDRVERARAEGNARMVENIHEAGFERVKSRKVVIDPQTKRPIYGDDGELLYDETYELDWRAHSWILERAFPEEWAKRQTLEVTGGAAAVIGQAESDAVASRMGQLLRESAERRQLEAAQEAEIVDAEVVDEPVE